MKADGQIIELDADKEYIFLFEPSVPHEMVEDFSNRAMRDGNIYILHLDCFKIVENSDRIVSFAISKGVIDGG